LLFSWAVKTRILPGLRAVSAQPATDLRVFPKNWRKRALINFGGMNAAGADLH